MAKKIALVDADALLYMAGFAAQKTRYHEVWEWEGNISQDFFDSVASIKAALSEEGTVILSKDPEVVLEPVENALSIAKTKMREMRDRYKNLEVYLKGDGTNWRNDVATIHGYKANRTAPKPAHLDAIKDYLVTNWSAVQINGKEADDQIATRAFERPAGSVVVCSIDKDLDQIPGLHWNYSKNVEYSISDDEALDFFYQQVLQGDYSDNVHGCWKCGEKRAKEIVRDTREEAEKEGVFFEGLVWDNIVNEYEVSMGLDGCPYAGMPPTEVALENARLVWMQSEANRLWTPYGWEKLYLAGTLDD